MTREKIDELLEIRSRLYEGGGASRIEKQHSAGKLTARERLAMLYEENTFQELGLFVGHRCNHFGMEDKAFPADGVVTGVGLIDGRPVYGVSQDFTVAAGTVGEMGARKVQELMDSSLRTGDPIIFINDSGGARIQEGVDALSGYGGIFYRNVMLSGVVPQISIISGPCAGGAAYSPALTDFIIQVEQQGQMYITGPKVIREVTGEEVTAEQLGGVVNHGYHSGVTHFVAGNEEDALDIARRVLGFLPANNTEDPPLMESMRNDLLGPCEGLNAVIPPDPKSPYNMHEILAQVLDGGELLEVMEHYAPNIIIGLGRLNGRSVGVVANQPMHKAGALDIDASDKASRFIRFCNSFNIPLITFVDVPGFLPGIEQEYGGIIRHGAKMLFSYGAATVPKLTVIVRKAYGGAYLAMCSREMGADRVCAWPSAEIAVMGAEGAVGVLYQHEIEQAEDPSEEFAQRVGEYKQAFASPYVAASRGYIHDIIVPADTRSYLASALEILISKQEMRPRKKHGLIPL